MRSEDQAPVALAGEAGAAPPNTSPTTILPPRDSTISLPARLPTPGVTRQAETPDDAARRALEGLARRLDQVDHYQLLGLERGASTSQIRAAAADLVRRYHPERLPPRLADLRAEAERLLRRVVLAYRVLKDPGSRAAYDQDHTTEPATPGQARGREAYAVKSALARAEQLLMLDRPSMAEVEAHRALTIDPQNPAAIAMHGWILSLMPEGTERLEEILGRITSALDREPMNQKIRFYRSLILKRLGRIDEARAEWRLVLEIEPGHLDAQRELRLWEMRNKSGFPPARSASGIESLNNTAERPSFFLRLFGRR